MKQAAASPPQPSFARRAPNRIGGAVMGGACCGEPARRAARRSMSCGGVRAAVGVSAPWHHIVALKPSGCGRCARCGRPARLKWLRDRTRFEIAMRRHGLALKYGYNPAQPRVPKGKDGGAMD